MFPEVTFEDDLTWTDGSISGRTLQWMLEGKAEHVWVCPECRNASLLFTDYRQTFMHVQLSEHISPNLGRVIDVLLYFCTAQSLNIVILCVTLMNVLVSLHKFVVVIILFLFCFFCFVFGSTVSRFTSFNYCEIYIPIMSQRSSISSV